MARAVQSSGTFRQLEDSRQATAIILEALPAAIERRGKLLDTLATDTATDTAAVATAELITFTFSVANDYRDIEIQFIADNSGTASDIIAVAYVINAGDDTAAAAALSLVETDSGTGAAYVARGESSGVVRTDSAIVRVDFTGILGSATAAVAKDLVTVAVS